MMARGVWSKVLLGVHKSWLTLGFTKVATLGTKQSEFHLDRWGGTDPPIESD